MSAKAKKQKALKIAPEEYREFIQGLSVKNIYAKSLRSVCLQEGLQPGPNKGLEMKEDVQYKVLEGDAFKVYQTYKLSIMEKVEKESIPRLEIECEYVVLYEAQVPMTDELFAVFSDINVPLNTWPYFREYVHSSFQRLNVPAFILPPFKL